MSKTLVLLTTLLASAALVVPSAQAGPKTAKGDMKSKGKTKTKGKGKGKPKPKPGKGKGKGKPKVVATVTGAGQRMAFSFGGRLRAREDGTVKGKFYLSAHPSDPTGNTVNVSCIYRNFTQMTVEDGTATIRASGRCRRLLADGAIQTVDADNLIQIVDNGSADQIDVNFVGGSGIAVPGGALSFGNFEVTGAT